MIQSNNQSVVIAVILALPCEVHDQQPPNQPLFRPKRKQQRHQVQLHGVFSISQTLCLLIDAHVQYPRHLTA